MKNVGIIIRDLYDTNYQTFLNGCRGVAEEYNIRLLVFHADRLFHMPILHSKKLDGLIIHSPAILAKYGKDMIEQFILSLDGLPIISVGAEIKGAKSIVINGAMGVEALMDHLIDHHGAKNIAFIKGPDTNMEAYERFEAYKSSLHKHNIPCNYKLITPGSFSHGDGRKAISLLMDIRKVEFDTVFCCHDLAALDVIKSLKSRGYRVPEDIRVVGFDNLDISGSFTPSLTTIRQPLFAVGKFSMNCISKLMGGSPQDEMISIETQLILRESCGCFRHIGSDITETDVDKWDLKDTVFEIRDDIIKKYIFSYGLKNQQDSISDAVFVIADSIISYGKSGDVYELAHEMEKLLGSSLQMQLDSTFWRFVLEEFFLGIQRAGFTSLFTNALLRLYEAEKRDMDHSRLEDGVLVQQINSIGDMLLTCSTEEEIKDILKGQLSSIHVGNCFVVRYLSESGQSELFFCRDTHELFEENYQVFDLENIIPDLKGDGGDESYIIIPLSDKDRDIGYVAFEYNSNPYILYSFVADKISFGLNNVRVIERLNSYNLELEIAVKDRTKELERVNRQLKERSIKDSLTGLYNRRFLEEVVYPKSRSLVEQQLEGCDVNSSTYGVILVDLDHFKLVNDVYGHASGDIVIRELGKIFSYLVRPEDYVIRLGGEEFLIILRQFNSDYLLSIVEKVRRGVKEHPFIMENGDSIYKTCSIGAMVFPVPGCPGLIEFSDVIAIIDKCLYKSKNDGRDKGLVIDIDVTQFVGCEAAGGYIVNNFDKCLASGKITLFDSKSGENR